MGGRRHERGNNDRNPTVPAYCNRTTHRRLSPQTVAVRQLSLGHRESGDGS